MAKTTAGARRTVRFDNLIDEAITRYAEEKKISRSKLIKQALEVYLLHNLSEEEILQAFKPQEREQVKQTVFDSLQGISDVLGQTIQNVNSNLNEKLVHITVMLERLIYINYYYGPSYEDEMKTTKAKLAKAMIARLLADIKADVQRRISNG